MASFFYGEEVGFERLDGEAVKLCQWHNFRGRGAGPRCGSRTQIPTVVSLDLNKEAFMKGPVDLSCRRGVRARHARAELKSLPLIGGFERLYKYLHNHFMRVKVIIVLKNFLRNILIK